MCHPALRNSINDILLIGGGAEVDGIAKTLRE